MQQCIGKFPVAMIRNLPSLSSERNEETTLGKDMFEVRGDFASLSWDDLLSRDSRHHVRRMFSSVKVLKYTFITKFYLG